MQLGQHETGREVARLILQDSLEMRNRVGWFPPRDGESRHGQPGRHETLVEL